MNKRTTSSINCTSCTRTSKQIHHSHLLPYVVLVNFIESLLLEQKRKNSDVSPKPKTKYILAVGKVNHENTGVLV